MKKFIRTGAALALSAATVTAMTAAASAEVIDFEDGNYESFVAMKVDDGGDFSVLSVEEFNGSKQLKVDVQDCSLLPKVQFDINAIVGTDNLSDINKIQMDLTFASKDGETPVGWIGGALGTAGGDNSPAWDQSDYEGGEYEKAVTEVMTIERKFLLPSKKYVSGTEGSIALLMRWGTEVPYVMYIDNVKFLDKDGNVMDLALNAEAAAPAEEAAAEEVVEEVAEEAAAEEVAEEAVVEEAPAADTTTTATATGNAAVSSIAALAACAAAVAAISRRK